MSGKLGKLPNDPEKPRLKLTRAHVDAFLLEHFIMANPAPPSIVDDISQVQNYPMYGNDRYGDCVWAMIGHHIQVSTRLGIGSEVDVTDDALLKGYSDVTGFDPSDPNSDQGTVIQDALDYWRKTGINKPDGSKDKILAFVQVDHTDRGLLADCIHLFGPGLKGFEFPDSAMDQFNAGQEWTVVSNSPIVGGHAILTAKYTLHSLTNMDTEDVTWGARQPISDPFNAKYVDEMWFVITQNWFNATGVDPNGEAASALGKDFTDLTGQPSPFPAPTPGPTPVPVPPAPTPTPVPTDVHVDSADRALMAALTPWDAARHIGPNRRAQKAYEAWLTAKRAIN
jgi:hypothetical protein